MTKRFIALLVAALMAACGGAGASQPQTAPTPETGAPAASPTPGASDPSDKAPAQQTLPSSIQNRAWKWARTQMNDGSIDLPARPDAFTITFHEDGTVSGTTDCNSFSGNYTLDGGLITFSNFASTLMACENSQEQAFHRYLGETQRYLIVDDQLVLEFRYDSGQIIFE